MSDRISDAEHVVMEVLWEDSPLGAVEVAERIPTEHGWNISTVKTLLSRLLAKGVLVHRKDGRRYLYSPTISREDFIGRESERLLERMFEGRLTPLVAHFAAQDRLSPDDIKEIEALLKELKS